MDPLLVLRAAAAFAGAATLFLLDRSLARPAELRPARLTRRAPEPRR